MMELLKGKNIIVTGTTRGVGRCMVETFAKNGASVFAHARKESEEHKEYCSKIASEKNVDIIPVYFDLTSSEEIKKAIKDIRSTKRPIDGLVNNAGITYNALFQMTSIDDVRDQMEVNFFAPFLLTQYVSKLMMRNNKGSIVNISSSAAQDGNSGKTAYGAAKAALLTMTLCISEELASSGIRANVICPGVIDTDMVSTMPDYVLDIQREASFLHKIATVNDIANTALYLLSDESSYVTGQVFRVDGGVTQYAKREIIKTNEA